VGKIGGNWELQIAKVRLLIGGESGAFFYFLISKFEFSRLIRSPPHVPRPSPYSLPDCADGLRIGGACGGVNAFQLADGYDRFLE
jgi:hypothetical protein